MPEKKFHAVGERFTFEVVTFSLFGLGLIAFTAWAFSQYLAAKHQTPAGLSFILSPEKVNESIAAYQGALGDLFGGYLGTVASLASTVILMAFWIAERAQNHGRDQLNGLVRGIEFILEAENRIRDQLRSNIHIVAEKIQARDDYIETVFRQHEPLSREKLQDYKKELDWLLSDVPEDTHVRVLQKNLGHLIALGKKLPTRSTRIEFETLLEVAFSSEYRGQLDLAVNTYRVKDEIKKRIEEQ